MDRETRARGSTVARPFADRPFIGRGFDDPVLASQRCFRRLLTAMSEPGTVHRLEDMIEVPAGVAPAAAGLLLTLTDAETPVWLSPGLEALADFVRFHSGAPLVAEPERACFALMEAGEAEPGLARFDAGDERYPDRSATVIVQVAALEGGARVSLSGPGIESARVVAPRGLRAGFWGEAIENHRRYPLGIDLVLVAANAFIGLPRSTRIAVSEGDG